MMKTKKLLTAALLLIAAGAALAAAGYFSGAERSAALGSRGVVIAASDSRAMKRQTGVPLKAFASVSADLKDSGVRFVPSDHYGMDVTYSEEAGKPEASVTDGTLRLTQPSSQSGRSWLRFNWGFTDSTKPGEVTVYYPKGTKMAQFSLQNDSGDVAVSGLSCGGMKLLCRYGGLSLDGVSCKTLDVQMENGDADCSSVSAGTLSYRNSYGDGRFRAVRVTGNSSLHSSNGDVGLESCSLPDLTVSDDYGGVSLSSVKTKRLNATLGNGDLHITDSTAEDILAKCSYGSVKASGLESSGADIRCGNGSVTLGGLLRGKTSLRSDYGTVSVKTSLPQQDYRCDCSTDYGSVTVAGRKYGKGVSIPTGAKNSLEITSGSGDIRVDFQSGADGAKA